MLQFLRRILRQPQRCASHSRERFAPSQALDDDDRGWPVPRIADNVDGHARRGGSMVKRAVAIMLALLGAYYAWLGSRTLLHLQAHTQRWIALSGDPDFRFDFSLFALTIGTGASLVAMLGAASVLCAFALLRGRPWSERSAVILAIAALLVHAPWFMYRVIATGYLPRGLAAEPIRAFGLRVLVICAQYFVVWVVQREDDPQHLARPA